MSERPSTIRIWLLASRRTPAPAVASPVAAATAGARARWGALLRNPASQTIVWVKEAPERFAPRVVTAVPLDGTSVAVTSGLQPGDRVATQGATLINQVR